MNTSEDTRRGPVTGIKDDDVMVQDEGYRTISLIDPVVAWVSQGSMMGSCRNK